MAMFRKKLSRLAARSRSSLTTCKLQKGPSHLKVVKEFTATATSDEIAILLVHATAGRMDPMVQTQIAVLNHKAIAVLLVLVAGHSVALSDNEHKAAGILLCEAPTDRLPAWSLAIMQVPEVWKARTLYLIDGSSALAGDNVRLAALVAGARASCADIVGSGTQRNREQLDGCFLALRQAALSAWPFQFMVRDSVAGAVKASYNFVNEMKAAGLSVEALEGTPTPTPHRAGAQLPQISCASRDLPDAPLGRLPHIAYFGPWNYESGLGEASREMLCALRRTGYPLNAYPITQPFHVHALVSPAVATTDFAGEPDIAIVHLNPDNWHMLTTAQRDVIRTARRRIGYWVWETDRIPPPWQANLHSVDRVWAPSHYCADTFGQAVNVPIDVIPHPVSLPNLTPAPLQKSRNHVLNRYGITLDRRVILYVFDGASYLVRKNPAALIRAFRASMLAARGWILLLKTKNLHDRPEAGEALEKLARATPGVMLVVASMGKQELAALAETADIYASSHCSEGFGLTVAEAMARGKPVVATDFGGTRDFLDASCGYPVRAEPWTLEKDHGHYLAGHSWAKVDESALTTALIHAADAVEAGKWVHGSTLAQAARRRIAEDLSHDAVAAKIESSIAVTLSAPVAGCRQIARPQPQSLRKKLSAVKAVSRARDFLAAKSRTKIFASARPFKNIVPVCLGSDMRPLGRLPEANDRAWYFIAPGNALLAPGAFAIVRAAIAARPDVSLFYADDVAPGMALPDRVRLKPEFDPTLLAVQDYIGAPVIVRAPVAQLVGGLDPAEGTAALYDFVLRVAENGSVARIPKVLIAHDGARTAVSEEQRREHVMRTPRYADYQFDIVEEKDLLTRRFDVSNMPPVTLVIPTRRSPLPSKSATYIERLLEEIAHADWPMDRLTVLVGDDIEEPPQWQVREWPFTLRRIITPRAPGESFNYAAKMNRLWRDCEDEQIVLLNDDVLPHSPGWLKALQTFALDQSVGGVGAQLFYENGTIQHAGIFSTLRIAVHAWIGTPADTPTYQQWASCQRRWSMMTGAVFATRRSLLDRVGGFDERLTLEFNDIDLCLRMRSLGLALVYNPAARFTHTEKASRGPNPPPAAEAALFLSRWSEWLKSDPASHPSYATNRTAVMPKVDQKGWYKNF